MRVIAIESFQDGHLKSYGEGEYLGEKVPLYSGLRLRVTSPCIKLDNGKYAWGFMCWWAEVERFNAEYKDSIKSVEMVEVNENIKPAE